MSKQPTRGTKFQLFSLGLATAMGLAIVMISYSMTTIGNELKQRHNGSDYGVIVSEPKNMLGGRKRYITSKMLDTTSPVKRKQVVESSAGWSIETSSINVEVKREARRLAPPDKAAAEGIQMDDEIMVLVGEYTDSFRNVSKSIQFFNISSQEWSNQSINLPSEVAETHQGVAFDQQNRILCIVAGQLGPARMPATTTAVRLFVDTQEFELFPPLPLPRYAPGVVIVPGTIPSTYSLHVFGGASGNRNDSATDHWRLNIDERRLSKFSHWEVLEPLPDAGTHGASFLSENGYLYYTSFCNLDPGMLESSSMAECHFHATKVSMQRLHHVSHAGLTFRFPTAAAKEAAGRSHWERVADMPFPVCHGGSMFHNDKLYLMGGSILTPQIAQGSAPNSWPAIQTYDPKQNEWNVEAFELPRRTHLFLLSTWIDMKRHKLFSLHPGNALLTMNLVDHASSSVGTEWSALIAQYQQQTREVAIAAQSASCRLANPAR